MRRHIAICFALVAITWIVFWPVLEHGFISFDDEVYVTGNAHVRAGLTWKGVGYAFTTSDNGNWHPLMWLTLLVDAEMYGVDVEGAGGFHLTNLLLHTFNVLLLFAVLVQMTGSTWKSAFVAALFAVHPLNVGTAAWISERKGVLSTLFGLLVLLAYTSYARRLNWKWMCVALAAFACGLMSKPMLMTLPFLLLLLDVWPLRRTKWPDFVKNDSQSVSASDDSHSTFPQQSRRRLLVEKVPFFALTAAFCVVAFLTQNRGGILGSLATYPFSTRIQNAVVVYADYIFKVFWPQKLTIHYPHPGNSIARADVAVAALLLIVITVVAIRQVRKRPYLLVGWLWYLGMLVPVIGLVQLGGQQMAIRYTYLPVVGIWVAVAWVIPSLVSNGMLRKFAMPALGSASVLACVVVSRSEVGYWRNTRTAFERALQVTENNGLAYNYIGNAFAYQKKFDEAIVYYQKAISIGGPYKSYAHVNLGLTYYDLKQYSEAEQQYRRALKIYPQYAAAHNFLGKATRAQGHFDEALEHFREATRIDPKFAEAQNYLGSLLHERGRLDEAIEHLQRAIDLAPDYYKAHNNLGWALRNKGEINRSINHYRLAVSIKPDYVLAHFNLGNALQQQGRQDEAVEHFRQVVALKPKHVIAWYNLGAILQFQGRLEQALECFRRVIQIDPQFHRARQALALVHTQLARRLLGQGSSQASFGHLKSVLAINPNSAEAHHLMGKIMAGQGKRDEGIKHIQRALELKPDFPAAKKSLEEIQANSP